MLVYCIHRGTANNIFCNQPILISSLPHTHTQFLYVSSDPEDYQKEFKDSLMYRYVDIHINSILLNITIPPGPVATPTTTNVPEGRMNIISIKENNKGKERSNINLYYNKKIINHYIIQYRDTGTS